MVSDFVMPAFENNIQAQINTAKRNNTKFHSLVIGNSQNAATIKEFDNNWFFDTNNKGSVLKLVRDLKTI